MKSTKLFIFRFILFAGTAVSLYFVPWIILRAWLPPLPDTVQEQVDDATELGFEGIIVYVDKAGEPPGFYASGWHDRDQEIPARADAYFKIASISKLYRAVALTKLLAEDRFSLDNTIAEIFPEYKDRIEYSDQITLRNLVQHRSGLPNFTDTENFWNEPTQSAEAAMALILDEPANFKPGEDYQYCNTNYLMISMLMNKELGYDHQEFIQERILEPIGCHHTFGSKEQIDINDLMSGYYVGIEEDMKTANYSCMVATAEDVGIFLRALNDGSVFQGDELEIYSSIYRFEHTGLVPGYQSKAHYFKDMDAVVIQFTNTTDFSGYHWNVSEVIYNRIVKILEKQ